MESRALLFLAGITVLGAGVRAGRTMRAEPPAVRSAGEAGEPSVRAALGAQLAAVDSAIAADSVRKARKNTGRKTRTSANSARADNTGQALIGNQPNTGALAPPPTPEAPLVVDLDRASQAEIEELPRIGPTLARRIVSDRDSLGPFGSLDGLQKRVAGIGCVTATLLRPHVTFSLPPRRFLVTERGQLEQAAQPCLRRRRNRAPAPGPP